MNGTAKNVLVVPALLVVMSVAWHFVAVASQSNRLATVLTNSAFCVLLAASVCRSRTRRGYALGTIVSILLFISAGFVGALVYESNHIIGDALMQSFNVGYYPPGPDAPFEIGVVVWSLSIALLVCVGLAVGVSVQKLLFTKGGGKSI